MAKRNKEIILPAAGNQPGTQGQTVEGSTPAAQGQTVPGRPPGAQGGGGFRGPMGAKAKNFKKSMASLFGYLKKQIPLLVIVLLLSAATAVVTILVPRTVADITKVIGKGYASGHIDTKKIGRVATVMAILVGLGAVGGYVKSVLMAEVTHRTARRFRGDINNKINLLPLSYFDSRSYGDVLSRVTNDVDTISQSLNQSVTTFVSSITLIVGVIIMMFITNWQLALIAITTVPLSFVIIALIVKFSQKHFRVMQKELGSLNGHIEEVYSGHEVVRAYCAENQTKAAFDLINVRLKKSTWKGNFLSGLMFPLMNFISNLGLAAVCVFGGVMIVKGHGGVTVPDIIAFMMYVRLFTSTMPQLAQVASSLQSTAAAAERVFEFLTENEMESEKDKPPVKIEEIKGRVEFKKIAFGYTPEKQIIKDFSAVAMPGQKIAVVGPTGAGKTTIVNLLMRFYEIGSGEIYIDGINTKDMTRTQVHGLFGMVLQDTWLFDGTIKENIVYSKEGISDADVYEACKKAGIDHIIKSLPGSYDMVLDDNANLSAGQKQLITIARAIVEDAPMLIFDEATSAVDTRTEVLIQQAMDKLMAGRTSFIIAHRLSTIKNADLILVVQDGGITEQGTHNELMQKGGFYSTMYSAQFEKV